MSEIFNHINWLHVLVGALGYFFLGALWYSFLFQKSWVRLNKIDLNDPNGKKGVGAIMFASFVFMFVCAAGIAVLQYELGVWDWKGGVKLGLLTGGFAFIAMAINMLYEKKPTGLYFINGGYQLLGNIIAAVVICSWH